MTRPEPARRDPGTSLDRAAEGQGGIDGLVDRLIRWDPCELGRAQLAIVVYSVVIRLAMAAATWRFGLSNLAVVGLAGAVYYLLLLLLRGRPAYRMLFILAYGVESSLWALLHWFVAGPHSSFELYPLVLNSVFVLLFRDLPTSKRMILIALPPFTTALVVYLAVQIGPIQALDLETQLWLSMTNEIVITLTVMAVIGAALLEQVRGRREAERREATQTQLVEDLSHELRTPLATMLTLTQGALAPGQGRERMTQRLEWIEESVREAHRLVERLLELAALDAADPAAKTASLAPLVEVARAATERARRVAEPRAIDIRFEAREDIDLRIDAVALEVVLRNVLANAMAHSSGGSRIDVSVWREGSAIRLDVVDQGEGIAPEHLELIFERMWRADPARTRSEGRYGLGLPIARRNAQLLGAWLRVESTVGHGSTFSLVFDKP